MGIKLYMDWSVCTSYDWGNEKPLRVKGISMSGEIQGGSKETPTTIRCAVSYLRPRCLLGIAGSQWCCYHTWEPMLWHSRLRCHWQHKHSRSECQFKSQLLPFWSSPPAIMPQKKNERWPMILHPCLPYRRARWSPGFGLAYSWLFGSFGVHIHQKTFH